jgi:glycosyltransferase involved in cell wall biosynthesis
VKVVQVDYGLHANVDDPGALLDRFPTLTGWSEALLAAGAGKVSVVQRFLRDDLVVRGGVDYVFRGGRMHDVVRSLRPDVVHVNGLCFPLEMWRLRRALPGTPIVVQDHAAGEPAPHLRRGLSVRRVAWRHALRSADAFFFTNREQAVPWQDAGLIAPSQTICDVLESSTSFEPCPQADARRETEVSGAPAVLWVGRLNDNKDPLTVLAGFEQSLAALPGARLTMVYAGGERAADVRARIDASRRLRERVRLIGEVPHARMAGFFSAADVFVLGSHHEGSGYALLEACACGAAPVVTDIPSFRTITGQAAVGALWRVGDAADACRALVDVGRRDLLTQRASVLAHFTRALSWSAVGERAMRAYREVIHYANRAL